MSFITLPGAGSFCYALSRMPKNTAKSVEALVAEIRDYCRSHADPANAGRYARYFREGYDAWGLLDKNHPVWTAGKQDWLDRYRHLGLAGFLKAGILLFESGKFEETSLAIQFVEALRGEFDERSFGKLGRWFEAGIANWAHTDALCALVISPLLESGRIPLAALGGWRESTHEYQRRAVPVAMLGLLKTATKVAVLLDFLRPLMLDSERVVHQGLGWFLREAWKRYPKEVEEFLLEWKDQAARLIFQYATEKMSAAGRARFRAAKRRPS